MDAKTIDLSVSLPEAALIGRLLSSHGAKLEDQVSMATDETDLVVIMNEFDQVGELHIKVTNAVTSLLKISIATNCTGAESE